ncbi:MAG: DUF1015 family protein [Holosporales bacterium]|nr:DUF1015 family protein [Holosporales bacterium]
MRINTFRAIRFEQNYWQEQNILKLNNFDTRTKVPKTYDIMNFLNQQIANGIAKIDGVASLYVLRLTAQDKGVVFVVGEVNYDDKIIFCVNEDVHDEKLKIYKNIFNQFKMQITPILTFYKSGRSVSSTVKDVTLLPPTLSAHISGVFYELWQIHDPLIVERIKHSLAEVEKLYVADGHHRLSMFNSSISKVSAKIIVSITDSDSVILKSCHRVIVGEIQKGWREDIQSYATLEKIRDDITLHNGKILLVLKNNEKYAINLNLDVENTELYDAVKNKIIHNSLGVSDYDGRVFPLPGTLDINNSQQIFNLYKGSSAIIFIPDITISNFLKMMETGEKLPPTSTWFEPKIIDGFIVRKF